MAKQQRGPNGLGHVADIPQLTATQKVAKDLGITDETVRNRTRNAVKLAERQGLVIDADKKTPEGLSGDQLIAVGEAARAAADSDQREARKKGKAPRNVNPHEPSGKTKVVAKLDTDDPQPFIDWCRKRLAGKHKPMSLSMLRSYRQALDDLIVEYEAKLE